MAYIPVEVPTPAQSQLMDELKTKGYLWDKIKSVQACGAIMRHPITQDEYFFGLDGEIMHNPEPWKR